MSPRVVLALGLVLLVRHGAWAASPESEPRLPVLEGVAVREHHGPTYGRGLELTFKPLEPEPALARFTVEEARTFVEALEMEFQAPRPWSRRPSLSGLPPAAMTASLLSGPPPDAHSSDLERRVRAAYAQLYGPPSMPLLSSLESSRWFLGLLMTYSAAELYTVGVACLNLYREAEAARTQEQLEAAAERFGKAIGGVGLRVLVTVAGAKLAKGLPEVPRGGLWARLSPPRFAFTGGGARGGFSVGAGSRAQVNVANGTVVLMGVSANTAAAAGASAVASARTTGACRDESDKGDAKRHHLATDKNDISDVSGGPWTPLFKRLFDRAGTSLDDPANIVYLIGHVGPHPKAYHEEVFRRLQDTLGECQTQAACRSRLVKALDSIASDVCTPSSTLNKLATKKP